ncbi:MAG: response regulator transcription factor [Kurthia sp.]
MPTLLLVDDDANIRELLHIFLSKEGYNMIEAKDGLEALDALDHQKIDLAIIDVMMPKMNGWELVEEIRAMSDLPIMMITAKGETAQKVHGFSLGVDDYIVKPFEPIEVVLRIKALLKRVNINSSQQLSIGHITMDRNSFSVKTTETNYQLPQKEFELLFKLTNYPNKTFTRQQLIEDIWGYDYEGDERTVDVHIKRIRERFNESTAGFRIKTVWRLGYRLELLTNET